MMQVDALEKELLRGLSDPAGQILAAVELRLRAEHEQSVVKQIKAKKLILKRLESELGAMRAELVEAMRAVKSLEQLRERQRQRFTREQDLAQQRFTDELGQRQFVQRRVRNKIPT
jgi:flagellar export protein FliJ